MCVCARACKCAYMGEFLGFFVVYFLKRESKSMELGGWAGERSSGGGHVLILYCIKNFK